MISVDISRRQGQFLVSAAFESDGGILALFGPSGSGSIATPLSGSTTT